MNEATSVNANMPINIACAPAGTLPDKITNAIIALSAANQIVFCLLNRNIENPRQIVKLIPL